MKLNRCFLCCKHQVSSCLQSNESNKLRKYLKTLNQGKWTNNLVDTSWLASVLLFVIGKLLSWAKLCFTSLIIIRIFLRLQLQLLLKIKSAFEIQIHTMPGGSSTSRFGYKNGTFSGGFYSHSRVSNCWSRKRSKVNFRTFANIWGEICNNLKCIFLALNVL